MDKFHIYMFNFLLCDDKNILCVCVCVCVSFCFCCFLYENWNYIITTNIRYFVAFPR